MVDSNEEIMVKIRFIAEQLGCTVEQLLAQNPDPKAIIEAHNNNTLKILTD